MRVGQGVAAGCGAVGTSARRKAAHEGEMWEEGVPVLAAGQAGGRREYAFRNTYLQTILWQSAVRLAKLLAALFGGSWS